MILAIARREWQSSFLSAHAWILLAASQFILAWIFLRILDGFTGLEVAQRKFGITLDLTLNLFSFTAVLALLCVPLLSMRMLSGEMRDGTFTLLGSAPVSLLEILLGKFLGLAAPILALALLPLLLSLALSFGTELDLGLLGAATLGVWLAGLQFAAAGLFASSLTTQPGLAAVLAYAILVLLSVIGSSSTAVTQAATLFDWLSWNEHLFWFLHGVVRTSDLLYFTLSIVLFLALAHRQMANRRLG